MFRELLGRGPLRHSGAPEGLSVPSGYVGVVQKGFVTDEWVGLVVSVEGQINKGDAEGSPT